MCLWSDQPRLKNTLSFMQNFFVALKKGRLFKIKIFGKLGLNLVFWESISSHTHAFFYILYSILWGKLSKNQFFFSKKQFFQNFDWSNLIFDQSKSCFKNSVSLCLVWLIEPVFRSIEHRVSGFLKTVLWLIQTPFQKFFSNFSSLSDLARQHKDFFVVFYLNFCKVFLPQGR